MLVTITARCSAVPPSALCAPPGARQIIVVVLPYRQGNSRSRGLLGSLRCSLHRDTHSPSWKRCAQNRSTAIAPHQASLPPSGPAATKGQSVLQ